MRTLEELKRTIRAGLRQISCDLVLENVKLVNVCSKEVYPTKIYILDGRVVSIEPEAQLDAAEHVDCGGLYAVPGLIDSHMHFESTMLAPEALAEFIVPAGTTTICADLMEIANVCGEAGIRAMLAGYEQLPYRMLVEVSSRVPTAPGLETNGAVMDDVSVNDIMQDETSISLGELDPSKILGEKEEYLKKIINTLRMRKIVNGHAIGRYRYFFRGAFGSSRNLSESVLQSIPLMLASLGVSIALTMSVVNIGAEGQYAMGAWAATGVALYARQLPEQMVLPAMLLAGSAAGALWCLLSMLPRILWGVNETILTLMFTYIALQWIDYWLFGTWRDPGSNMPISASLPSNALFSKFGDTRVNSAIFLALFSALVLWFVYRKTATGYRMRVIGSSPRAARYAGMKIGRAMVLAMLVSGGLAGLAGVAQVGGAAGRLYTNPADGAGYTALIISRLAKNDPLLIVLLSLFFGGLIQGSYSLQMALIPSEMSSLLQGAILLCSLASDIFVANRLVIRVKARV